MAHAAHVGPNRPPLLILLLNCLVAAILTAGWLRAITTFGISQYCVIPEASALSLALTSLLVFHLMVWRYFAPVHAALEGYLPIGPLNIPIPIVLLVLLYNSLHPWQLHNWALEKKYRDWAFQVLMLTLIAVVVVYGLTARSPFRESDAIQVILGFSVQRLPGKINNYEPGEVLHLKEGEKVLVRAQILGSTDVICKWFTAEDEPPPRNDCSVLYNPSLGTRTDTLTVLAQPPCGQEQSFRGLFIAVDQDRG